MKTENTDTTQDKSKKEQWKREKVASKIIDFESAKDAMSQRQFAKFHGVSRTTLQHWLSRKRLLDAEPQLIEFLECPVGIAFLHRIIIAAHFEFCKKGSASIHNVNNFLKKSGLESFVGTSYSTQRNVANNMDKAIIEFGECEQKRLAATMPEKLITLCEDETFHPEICMVSIEAISNFIILEEYVEKRDVETWNKVVSKALEGLAVKVIQVTSDEAKSLISHTEKGLGAHHSPDVFHVQQEIGKGTSGALAGTVKKSEKEVEVAGKQTQKKIQTKEQYDNQPKRPRGRRPNFEGKIAEASEQERQAKSALDTARQNQETVKQVRQEIGKCYHPYNAETGEKQDAEKMSELLESNFEKINSAIAELSDRSKKRVNKAHRVVSDMVASIGFFFIMIGQHMDNLEISKLERQIMDYNLIPGFYLKQIARKEKDEIRKGIIIEKSKELLSILTDPDGPLFGYSDEKKNALEIIAKNCANIFQRSSSCVEGRNAQLSLRHHGIHRLSVLHLKAQTVIHNYTIKNREGTTPAERFFEEKHNVLFEWLLGHMDYPVRPRKRLTKTA